MKTDRPHTTKPSSVLWFMLLPVYLLHPKCPCGGILVSLWIRLKLPSLPVSIHHPIECPMIPILSSLFSGALWFLFLYLFIFIFYGYVQGCVCALCAGPMGMRRKHWVPWNRSYRWWWASMWMLGVKSRFCKIRRTLNLSHLSSLQGSSFW